MLLCRNLDSHGSDIPWGEEEGPLLGPKLLPAFLEKVADSLQSRSDHKIIRRGNSEHGLGSIEMPRK